MNRSVLASIGLTGLTGLCLRLSRFQYCHGVVRNFADILARAVGQTARPHRILQTERNLPSWSWMIWIQIWQGFILSPPDRVANWKEVLSWFKLANCGLMKRGFPSQIEMMEVSPPPPWNLVSSRHGQINELALGAKTKTHADIGSTM